MKTRSPGHAPAAKSSTLMTQTLLFLAALACFAAGFYAVGWDSDYARSVFRLSTLILLCVSGAHVGFCNSCATNAFEGRRDEENRLGKLD